MARETVYSSKSAFGILITGFLSGIAVGIAGTAVYLKAYLKNENIQPLSQLYFYCPPTSQPTTQTSQPTREAESELKRIADDNLKKAIPVERADRR